MDERVIGEAVPFRYVATATPSPTSLSSCWRTRHFLASPDVGQAWTRFFKRNSEKTDELTPSAQGARVLLWVASWALFVQKPSDLGHSDDGYSFARKWTSTGTRFHPTIPPMLVPTIRGKAAVRAAGHRRSTSARKKRESLPKRIEKMMISVPSTRLRTASFGTTLRQSDKQSKKRSRCGKRLRRAGR